MNIYPNALRKKIASSSYFCIYVLLASLTSVGPVLAAAGAKVGEETLVNTATAGIQNTPAVAMDADGDYVVVWEGPDEVLSGIYAQRYSVNGSAIGNEIFVNTVATTEQASPDVAMDAHGNFVVVWHSDISTANGRDIRAQRFSAEGQKIGGEFVINSTTEFNQLFPSIAMNVDGDFVIAWQSEHEASENGIYAQRFNAEAMPVGTEFRVNAYTENQQQLPDVAMDANGNFVIAWQSLGQDGNNYGVFAQRYSSGGTEQGTNFQVNTATSYAQWHPSVAMAANGDFVIAFETRNIGNSNYDVAYRVYSADGTAITIPYRVNTFLIEDQKYPVASMDADGDFAISWQSFSQEGLSGKRNGVYAQRIHANGAAKGATDIHVNTETVWDQLSPAIAMDTDGDILIVWASESQDSNLSWDIYSQRFEGESKAVDLSVVVNDEDPVTTGNNYSYTVIVSNNGSGKAYDVSMSSLLPTGVSYVSDDSASFDWVCSENANLLSCNKTVMQGGESNTIDVVASADVAGSVTHTVTVTSAHKDSTENSDSENTVIADPSSLPAPPSETPLEDSGGAMSWFVFLLVLPLLLVRALTTQRQKILGELT